VQLKQDIHTLKGVAGNLGAYLLSSACAQWELDFNRNSYAINQVIDALCETLAKMRAVLSEWQRENSTGQVKNHKAEQSATEAMTFESASLMMEEVYQALQRSDYVDVEGLQPLAALLDEEGEELLKELLKSIDTFDNDKAMGATLRLASALRNSCGISGTVKDEQLTS
jgi:HPt (histidine-containing phosphotransfer) domain-containing protein